MDKEAKLSKAVRAMACEMQAYHNPGRYETMLHVKMAFRRKRPLDLSKSITNAQLWRRFESTMHFDGFKGKHAYLCNGCGYIHYNNWIYEPGQCCDRYDAFDRRRVWIVENCHLGEEIHANPTYGVHSPKGGYLPVKVWLRKFHPTTENHNTTENQANSAETSVIFTLARLELFTLL